MGRRRRNPRLTPLLGDRREPMCEVLPECATVLISRQGTRRGADVAQLVERNLAKVEVAGSNPVVRSEEVSRLDSLVEWPRGEATACKAVYTGSNPVSTSKPEWTWAIGAAVARFPDTEEVTGSIPVSPTRNEPF